MKTTIKDINKIISLCEKMITYLHINKIIYPGNELYNTYKKEITTLFNNVDIDKSSYAPYKELKRLYFSTFSYTVNLEEATAILENVKKVKHDLFSNQYDRIFISHREVDKEQVELFIDLLHSIGIPRSTRENPQKTIFCTSHPEGYIENGKRNLDAIKEEFHNDFHTFYILWYTDNYFSSQACLNEMGAIWVTNKKYQEILMPTFNEMHIKGLLDKQYIWFKVNDKFRLNTFKEQLEVMFNLSPIDQNSWEMARDKFIKSIDKF